MYFRLILCSSINTYENVPIVQQCALLKPTLTIVGTILQPLWNSHYWMFLELCESYELR